MSCGLLRVPRPRTRQLDRPPSASSIVADLAALLARCRLLVSGDSGPLHAASLVGTPVVQLLGPTHPVENTPFPATPFRSLRAGLSCSPCRRGCAAASCMSAIGVESIQEACESLLGLAGKAGAAEAQE